MTETHTATLDETRQSDEQLLLDYCSTGNSESFNALVHRYDRELYGYLRRYLDDAALAEDVFQQVFLKVHLKCDQFRPGLKVRPWLYRIATNQAIDAIRRKQRHYVPSLDRCNAGDDPSGATLGELLTSKTPQPDEVLDRDERQSWVQQAVKQLPENLSEIVTLVHLKGLKYREAAEILSIPLGTLKSRLHTAVRMLQDACPAHFAPVA